MIKKIKLNGTNIKKKIRERIDAALQYTHNHFFCFLPGNISWITSYLFKIFFSGITIHKNQVSILQNLPKDGIYIYAAKYKSYFDFLFSYIRYQQESLPFPEIVFDFKVVFFQPVTRIFKIFLAVLDSLLQNRSLPDPYKNGYFHEELLSGRSAFLTLVEKKGFYRRFVKAKNDPLNYLIEMQKSIDRPIFIIPQLIFFGKKPHRSNPRLSDTLFGTEEKPGKIRRIVTLFKNPGKVFVEISEPMDLRQFLNSPQNREQTVEYQSLALRNRLLDQINRHRQSITGPILKSREELEGTVLTNNQLQKDMARYAKTHNIPLYKAHKMSAAYLNEISAKYNIAIIKILETLIDWVLNIMFEGVTVSTAMLNRIKNLSQKGPLIFIPCHKSHIDYLTLSLILFKNNMPVPHIAAGKNLSFWPLGPIFRGSGAFFIRRSFKGAVLYSKVFSAYIQMLLKEGFNIEFFIEGGRSRTGKLALPKLGFLSILLNAYKNGACEDMIFIPTFIGYDRVVEESAYLNEIEGGKKNPESLLQMIKMRKFLKKRYGKIYIKFHEPISLKELFRQSDIHLKKLSPKETNRLCRNLGHRIVNSIDSISVVTPHAIVASAILNCSKKRFSYDYLMFQVETYMTYLSSQNAPLADSLVFDSTHAVDHALQSYVQRKFIELIPSMNNDPSPNKHYRTKENGRPNIEYYKNNCVALFIPAAFTSLAILKIDKFQFLASDLHDSYVFLQEFFKNEFAYNTERTIEYMVQKNIKAFVDDAVLTPHPTSPDTYDLTAVGLKKLKLFSSFLKTYFESYAVVIDFFRRHSLDAVQSKERLKKIITGGNRMYKKHKIERKESLSKIYYQNALDYFISKGIKGAEDEEKIEFYVNTMKGYINHLHS